MRAALYAFVVSLLGMSPAMAGNLAAPEALSRAQAGALAIIDIRTPEEWRQTGIPPGAKLVDFYNPAGADAFVAEVLKAAGGDKAAPLGVICRSGNRSGKAVALLESRGFTNLQDIGEGMNGWQRRGLPVTR